MTALMLLCFLACSFLASCVIWDRLIRRDGNWMLKVLHALFAAVPIVGPMFYFFLIPASDDALEEPPPAAAKSLTPPTAEQINSRSHQS